MTRMKETKKNYEKPTSDVIALGDNLMNYTSIPGGGTVDKPGPQGAPRYDEDDANWDE